MKPVKTVSVDANLKRLCHKIIQAWKKPTITTFIGQFEGAANGYSASFSGDFVGV